MLLHTVLLAFLATAVYATGPQQYHIYTIKEEITRNCEKNNITSDKVEQAKTLIDEYEECYPRIGHFEQLPAEFEAAKGNGTVDEFARRFCAKAELTKSCAAKIYLGMGLCGIMDMQEVSDIKTILNRLTDYVCNEEDHKTILTKFVDDGALQCFNDRRDEFVQCANLAPVPVTNLKATFEITSRCMVEKMKDCSAAAGLRAQNLFDYIRNAL